MARTPTAADLKKIDSLLGDITTKLDRVSSGYEGWIQSGKDNLQAHIDLTRELDAMIKLEEKYGKLQEDEQQHVRDLTAEMAKLENKHKSLAKVIGGSLIGAFDKLGKSIISLGLASFETGLTKLSIGIEKVYELQERWAKLMGEFRNKLGVTTKNLGSMSKVAADVEGKIYGLTGAFGQGAPMVGEFLDSLGRVEATTEGGVKALAEMVKGGTLASRVLGITAGEAGEMTKTLQQLGEGVPEQKKLWAQISSGAEAAGVSSAQFGKEIAQNQDFMASFGKEGRKTFIQMTAFAKKLGVSLKSLQAFTQMTDTFDSTTESVAKLNTVFGTTINSLDLMLEQDPSKRLETVRQALLDQGKSFDQLSRQERSFLAQTMKISETELAGVLKTGKTLEEVQKDQEDAQVQHETSQRNMDKLINKTATTLFSFGQAWDKVTVAIGHLIKPFTDVLGLTNSGEKGAKSFSQVMKGLFDRLVKFINEVAGNPEWIDFMKRLAADAVKLGKSISDYVTGPELGKWIKSVVKFGGDFYDIMKKAFQFITKAAEKLAPVLTFLMTHIKGILAAWAIMKGGMGIANVVGKVSGLAGAMRGPGGGEAGAGAGGGMGGGGGMMKMAGGALAGAAGGAAVTGGGIAGTIGGAIGGGAASFIPVLGPLLAPFIGAGVGYLTQKIADHLTETPESKRLSESLKELEKTQDKLKESDIELETAQHGLIRAQEEQQQKNKQIESIIHDGKRKGITLDETQRQALTDRVKNMNDLGISLGGADSAFKKLSDPTSGSISLSAKEIQLLKEKTVAYNLVVTDLAKQSKTFLDNLVDTSAVELQKKKIATDKQILDDEIKLAAQKDAEAQKASGIMDQLRGTFAGDKEADKRIMARLATEAKLQDLQSDKAKLDKTAFELQMQSNKQMRAKLEIERIMIDPKYQEKLKAANGDVAKAMIQYAGTVGEVSSEAYDLILGSRHKGDRPSMGDVAQHAAGGIVTRPHTAMVGENGPEAIIPLRAMARGSARNPNKFGGDAAKRLVNFAGGNNAPAGNAPMTVVAGDVYLDGTVVGRHIVRKLLSSETGG